MARVPLTHWWHGTFLFFFLPSFYFLCIMLPVSLDCPFIFTPSILSHLFTHYFYKCGVNIFFIDFSYIHVQLTEDFRLRYIIKIKTEKYHSVGIFLKSNGNILERVKIDTTNTHIHDYSLSLLSTGTSIKRDGVKQITLGKRHTIIK